MGGNANIFVLLEEMLDSEKTPEEVCRDCPDLLPAVQDQWEEFCRIDAEVEALLPGPGSPPIADSIIPAAPAACLPQVPGYELEAVLGRGGMGVVFKARHLTLKRVVALKMLLAGAYARPEELARFRREAEAVAALRHPNIVPVHDAGDITGRPYFTMEYVEGGSLAQSLAGKPQPPRRAAPRSWSPRWRRRSSSRTRAASSIATSSRPTSCSRRTACRRSPISAWSGRSSRAPR